MTLSSHNEQVQHYSAIKRRLWSVPERPAKPAPARAVARQVYDDPIGPQKAVARQAYAQPIGPVKAVVSVKGRLPPRANLIMAETAALYGVSVLDLKSKRQDRLVCRARDACGWELKRQTLLSLTLIGRRLGNRDHSTTLKSIRRHEARIAAGEVMP